MNVFSFMIPKSSKAIFDTQVAESMIKNALQSKKGSHVITNAEMIEPSDSVA